MSISFKSLLQVPLVKEVFGVVDALTVGTASLFLIILSYTMLTGFYSGYVKYTELEKSGYDLSTAQFKTYVRGGQCTQIFDESLNEISREPHYDKNQTEVPQCLERNQVRGAVMTGLKSARGINGNIAMEIFLFVAGTIGIVALMIGHANLEVLTRSRAKKITMVIWAFAASFIFLLTFVNYSPSSREYSSGSVNVKTMYTNTNTGETIDLPYTYLGKLVYLGNK